MTSRRAWWLTTLSTIATLFAAISLGPAATFAQQAYLPGAGMPQPGAFNPGAAGQPQMMWSPAQPPGYGAYGGGGYGAAPAGYYAPPPYIEVAPGVYREAVGPQGGPPVGAMAGGAMDGEYGDEANCPDESGRQYYNPLAMLAPYSEAGQCTTHWLDIEAEVLYLGLHRYASPFVVFSKDITGANEITSDALDPAKRAGFRLTAAKQVGPGSDLEFTYLGLFQYDRVATATGSQNLMSVFSNFNQLNNDIGLQHFDFADLHQTEYFDTMNSFELNYRRRWQGSSCLVQGSWLVGARYINLTERLEFLSLDNRPANPPSRPNASIGSGHYNLDTGNSMPGGQVGGDLWLCLLPGLNIGVEGKSALFGSFAQQTTSIYSLDTQTGFNPILQPNPEHVSYEKVSFAGELSLMLNYRVSPKLTFRGGYEVFYLDGLALAMQNFNSAVGPPFTPRNPFLNTNGSLLYSGFTFGGEWMW